MAKAIHTMIRVLDLDKSIEFYDQAFGLKVADRFDFDGFTLCYLRNDENDVEIDLSEILRMLRRRIRVLVGCVLLVTAAVLLVSYQLTPRYTATAQVLIDPRERNVTDLESVVAGLSPESSTVESQVEVFRSRSLATPLIEAMQLDRDPEFNPALREPGAHRLQIGHVAFTGPTMSC